MFSIYQYEVPRKPFQQHQRIAKCPGITKCLPHQPSLTRNYSPKGRRTVLVRKSASSPSVADWQATTQESLPLSTAPETQPWPAMRGDGGTRKRDGRSIEQPAGGGQSGDRRLTFCTLARRPREPHWAVLGGGRKPPPPPPSCPVLLTPARRYVCPCPADRLKTSTRRWKSLVPGHRCLRSSLMQNR